MSKLFTHSGFSRLGQKHTQTSFKPFLQRGKGLQSNGHVSILIVLFSPLYSQPLRHETRDGLWIDNMQQRRCDHVVCTHYQDTGFDSDSYSSDMSE